TCLEFVCPSRIRWHQIPALPAMLESPVCLLLGVIAMSEAVIDAAAIPAPLTNLTEDEVLFRDNVRHFAEDKLRPLVREMDEKQAFDHKLVEQFFQLGLMGIEVPEQYGGGAGSFFEAILAVEEISRIDPSSGVLGDVQNTLVK